MNRRFKIYKLVGYRRVSGWLRPGTLTVVGVLDSAQRSQSISGGIAEIGVHHGKFFIGLSLLQRDDEQSVAIDLFGDQDSNVDRSGKGDLGQFMANLERWASLERVVVHQGDSTMLTSDDVRALAKSDIRFFSIDGGHTDETVFSDMRLAEDALCPGGIVIADDFFNEWWPGVASGTLRYMAQGGRLQPFAVGFNKVFFSSPEYATSYREALATYVAKKYPLVAKTSTLSGHDVLVVGRETPKLRRLISRSATARKAYYLTRPRSLSNGVDVR